MAQKKVLILVGDFVEDLEAYFAKQGLELLNFEVHTASPGKKKGDIVATAVHDFEGFATYTEKRGHNFPITNDWDSINANNYDGLYIPGGRSPEYLRTFDTVLTLVHKFFEAHKPVAAICHGPQILVAANVVKGKTLTSYGDCKWELQAAGANWVKIDHLEAVVDNNLVTGVDWCGNTAVVKKFAELLHK